MIEYVGKTIQEEVPTTDKVARLGGEEFLVLLRETDLANGRVLAYRIRGKIAASLVPARGGPEVHITVSVGLSIAREDRDIADVIERADRTLYAAKTTGRNRLVSDEIAGVKDAA